MCGGARLFDFRHPPLFDKGDANSNPTDRHRIAQVIQCFRRSLGARAYLNIQPRVARFAGYSHSMVPGGFDVMS